MSVCNHIVIGWLNVECFSADVRIFSTRAFLIIMLVLMYPFIVLFFFLSFFLFLRVKTTDGISPARVAAKIAVASDQMQSPCANAKRDERLAQRFFPYLENEER